ncbi:MAG: heme biosynthesis protein HemY [Alphaproteobacteria bacterium]
MLRAVIFLIKVAIIVAAAVWLADRPGAVVIEWQGWVIETTVGILLAATVTLALILVLFWEAFAAVRRAPARFMHNRRLKRRERGYRALTLGMVAVAAGDADEARRQARRADGLLHDPPLTMLLAAQSAQLDGDSAAARRYFTEMLERPDTAFLGLRGLLMQAQRDGDYPRAVELAERANRQRPGTRWVLETLFDLQARSGRWADAERTIETMEKHRLLAKPEARHKRAVLQVERVREVSATGDGDRALVIAQSAHKLDPELIPASVELARRQFAAGSPRKAERTIAEAWKRAPHPALLAVFREMIAGQPPLDRYARCQKLAAANPDHRETRIMLAETAIEAELWAEARRHLRDASQPEPSARVCRLMADVEMRENNDPEAARAWLERAVEAEPDPAWVSRETGVALDDWAAVPGDGGFDTLEWRVPDRLRRVPHAQPLVLEQTAPAPQGTAADSAEPDGRRA